MNSKKNYGFRHDLAHPVLRWGYIFVLPGLASYLLFTLYPVVRAFVQSAYRIRGGNVDWVFIGLDNYAAVLGERVFWTALGNTFFYVLMTVPLGTGLSFLMASALNAVDRFKGFFRALYFIPSVAGVIAIGIVFTWIYEPYTGLLNLLLKMAGLPGLKWLRDGGLALPSIAVMTVWRTMGYNVVILLAGLLAIPRDYYESAQLDGASFLWRTFGITLPLLAPTLWFVIINSTIQDLQVFSEVFVMTGGGPGHATTTMGFKIYQEAFLYFAYGRASAIAVVMLLIILTVTVVQIRTSEGNTRVNRG
jgi:multiple sugar transport system permease protein